MKMSTTEKEIIGEIICAMIGERRCKKSSRYIVRCIDDYSVTLEVSSENDPFYEDIVELIEFNEKQNAYLGIQRLGYASCVSKKPEKPIVDPVVEQYFKDIKPTNNGTVQFTVQFPINFNNIELVIRKFIESERLGLNCNYLKLMEMLETDIIGGKYDVDDDYL